MATRFFKFLSEFLSLCIKIQVREVFGKYLTTGTCLKSPAVFAFVAIEFCLADELVGLEDTLGLEFLVRFGYHERIKVEDVLNLSCGEVAEGPDARWNTLEEPDVRDRGCELDIAHPFPADMLAGDFHTAPVADNAFVFNPLIFPAVTLPVLGRPENCLTEEALELGPEGAVVNCFCFLHLAAVASVHFWADEGFTGGDGAAPAFAAGALRQLFDFLRRSDFEGDTVKWGCHCGFSPIDSDVCLDLGTARGRPSPHGPRIGMLLFFRRIQGNAETEALQFAHENVERLRCARGFGVEPFHHRLINFGSAHEIVGFEREHLL